jgi:hypothetical protein
LNRCAVCVSISNGFIVIERVQVEWLAHTSIVTQSNTKNIGCRTARLVREIMTIENILAPLVTAPGLLALHGVGVDTLATLLAAAGDNPG